MKVSFKIDWSEEDECFIAVCPEFPGLSAFGSSPEEALIEAKVALKLFQEKKVEDERVWNYNAGYVEASKLWSSRVTLLENKLKEVANHISSCPEECDCDIDEFIENYAGR